MSSDSSLVETRVVGDIVEVRLNRPEKLNAVNEELERALHSELQRLSKDPERALLLTGEGRATCAGADTDMVSDPDFKEQHSHAHRYRHIENPKLLEEYPLPTAMAAKGAVVGTGFALSLCCDFVVLGEETHYSYPEIEHGIVGPPDRIERAVGPRLTKEIMMTGDPIPPERAREMGLVNEVVPEEGVEERTRELLKRVMEHDAEVLKGLKEEIDSLWTRRSPGLDTPVD